MADQVVLGTSFEPAVHNLQKSHRPQALVDGFGENAPIRVNASGEPIRAALRKAGIRVISVGMNTLFDALEVEAARKLFLMMNGELSQAEVLKAWVEADIGVEPTGSLSEAQLPRSSPIQRKQSIADRQKFGKSLFAVLLLIPWASLYLRSLVKRRHFNLQRIVERRELRLHPFTLSKRS